MKGPLSCSQSQPFDTILSQLNPAHIITPYFPTIHLILSLHLQLVSYLGILGLKFYKDFAIF
jgi:hypothetical protein